MEFATSPSLIAKRDVALYPRRAQVRPDRIEVRTSGIPGEPIGRATGLFPGRLDMAFGWVASPACPKLHNDAITAIRNFPEPTDYPLSGSGSCGSYIFVCDCMAIERPA